MSELIDLLKKHESMKLLPYTDTTGHLTIGVGRNLTDVGISIDEAEYLLTNDVHHFQGELRRAFPWFSLQLAARQDAITDMAFNMGIVGLLKFKNTLKHIQAEEYDLAATGMLESKWAGQVGERALRLSKMMRTGEYE